LDVVLGPEPMEELVLNLVAHQRDARSPEPCPDASRRKFPLSSAGALQAERLLQLALEDHGRLAHAPGETVQPMGTQVVTLVAELERGRRDARPA
jgi:hypothetical protein